MGVIRRTPHRPHERPQLHSPVSFYDFFSRELRSANPTAKLARDACRTFDHKNCRICPAIGHTYPRELEAKRRAFASFWSTLGFEGDLHPVVASPNGRNYRTVSKRRAFKDKFRRTCLAMTDVSDEGVRPLNVIECPIEPALHSQIYRAVQQFIWEPDAKAFSGVISHVIIKGDFTKVWIILNVVDMDGKINALINRLSKILTRKFPAIQGISLVIEERSRFYLSNEAHATFRKVHGSVEVTQPVGKWSYTFHPLSFSQTNFSILPDFVETAVNMMAGIRAVADLYCGYGLFGMALASTADQIVGVDSAEPSVRSGKQAVRHNKWGHVKFIRNRVSPESVEDTLEGMMRPLGVILDPPRSGVEAGVIKAVADQRPDKVVHIFCEVDLLAAECKQWQRNGYAVKKVVPFDMFPATSHLEIMVLLQPK